VCNGTVGVGGGGGIVFNRGAKGEGFHQTGDGTTKKGITAKAHYPEGDESGGAKSGKLANAREPGKEEKVAESGRNAVPRKRGTTKRGRARKPQGTKEIRR